MSNNKYWFSDKTTGKGVRLPISKEGKLFTLLYVIIGVAAVILSVPKVQNPDFVQYLPLIAVAILLIIVYITVTTLKAQPRPSKK